MLETEPYVTPPLAPVDVPIGAAAEQAVVVVATPDEEPIAEDPVDG